MPSDQEMPPSEFGGKVDPNTGIQADERYQPRPHERLRQVYRTGDESKTPPVYEDHTEATMTGLLPAQVQEEIIRQAGLLEKGVEL